MVEGLPLPTKEDPRDRRAELDEQLRVGDWPAPGRVVSRLRRELGTPSWWAGDKEATDSFLKSMGIVLE